MMPGCVLQAYHRCDDNKGCGSCAFKGCGRSMCLSHSHIVVDTREERRHHETIHHYTLNWSCIECKPKMDAARNRGAMITCGIVCCVILLFIIIAAASPSRRTGYCS